MVFSEFDNDPCTGTEEFTAQIIVLDPPGMIRNGYHMGVSFHASSPVGCRLE